MKPPKILIAQSDRATATTLCTALRAQDWDAIMATDATQALSFAMKERPGAVILSSQLPGGGGLFVLKRMRLSVHTATIPVVATATQGGPAKHEFLAAGAVEYMEQPVEGERLCAVISQHLGRPLTPNEAPAEALRAPERVAALKQTGLLDSPPSEAFDSLTRLAANLLDAPVALVSLVDKDRQFFKSQVGLTGPVAEARQTPLSHSFCQWVVSSQDELVVADARQHPGLMSNLAVHDLGVIAYAGVPVSASGGQVIGSFCAIDSKARPWTEDEMVTLRELAKVAQAYTALAEAKGPGPGQGALVAALSTAIACASRILQRGGGRLQERERASLLQTVERLSQELEKATRQS